MTDLSTRLSQIRERQEKGITHGVGFRLDALTAFDDIAFLLSQLTLSESRVAEAREKALEEAAAYHDGLAEVSMTNAQGLPERGMIRGFVEENAKKHREYAAQIRALKEGGHV